MNYGIINLMALSGKIAVESTPINRYAKEATKTGIDWVADIAKQTQERNQINFSVAGLSLGDIRAIKTAARTYALERVILYPCVVNGSWTVCIGADGGNINAFYNALGTESLKKSSITSSCDEQDSLFAEYGVTLFLRSDEE